MRENERNKKPYSIKEIHIRSTNEAICKKYSKESTLTREKLILNISGLNHYVIITTTTNLCIMLLLVKEPRENTTLNN